MPWSDQTINTFIATLPATIAALGALIVGIINSLKVSRNNTTADEINRKVDDNTAKTEQVAKSVNGHLDDLKKDKEVVTQQLAEMVKEKQSSDITQAVKNSETAREISDLKSNGAQTTPIVAVVVDNSGNAQKPKSPTTNATNWAGESNESQH